MSKLGKSLGIALWLAGVPGASFAVWQINTVGTAGGAFHDVTVTAGRDTADTLLFIYAVSDDNYLYEYGWNGSAWTGGSIGAATSNDLRGVAAGCPDADGNTRVYASSWSGNFYQYLYNGSAWSWTVINPAFNNYNRCTIGSTHNTAAQYLFAGNSNHRVYELDLVENSLNQIDEIGDEFFAVDVGDGRNNGGQQLFATNLNGVIYEYPWTGATYSRQQVADEGEPMYAVRVGPGRNGVATNFVYGGYQDGLVYEYQFAVGTWSRVSTLGGPASNNTPCRGLSIGSGRGDGVRRVYAGFADGSVHEFTWNGSGWSDVTLGTATGSGLNGLAVGQGRQSAGQTTVFAAGANSTLYEYRWLTDTPTRSPTVTATPTVTPTPSASATYSATPTRTPSPSVTPTATTSATVTRSPTYIPATDLSRLVVYPNPYHADQNHTEAIKFGSLPPGAVVRVFALTGERVRTLEKDPTRYPLAWDLRNEAGAPVASGVYLYTVRTQDGTTRHGKLAVLR